MYSFLIRLVSNWFVFSFEYLLDREYEHWYDPKDPKAYKNGTITLNGFNEKQLQTKSNIVNISMQRKTGFWEVENVLLEVGNLSRTGLTLCITNRENAIFAADPSFELKKMMNQAICRQDQGCSFGSSKENSPTIFLRNMSTLTVQLESKDYLFANGSSNSYDQLVDDITLWKEAGSCSTSARIAVGRMFFSKYSLVFRFSTDETRNHILSIGEKKEIKPLTKAQKTLLVGLGLGMIGMVLLVMVTKSVLAARRGSKDAQQQPGDQYASAAADDE